MGEPNQNQQRPSSSQAQNGQPEKLARGVVARGRTVDVPDPTQRVVVGHTAEGKPIHRAPIRQYGPGQEIELPAREIKTLRDRGFLLDPDQALPPLAEGPHYTETGAHASAA